LEVNMEILIISEDTELAPVVTGIIEGSDFRGVSAPGGLEGYEKAKTEKPDVILLDIVKGEVSRGLEIVAKLRDNAGTANIPVFVLVDDPEPENLLAEYARDEEYSNVYAALQKPVSPESLLADLKSVSGG
jgi:CheY-like chemotaxis protein